MFLKENCFVFSVCPNVNCSLKKKIIFQLLCNVTLKHANEKINVSKKSAKATILPVFCYLLDLVDQFSRSSCPILRSILWLLGDILSHLPIVPKN